MDGPTSEVKREFDAIGERFKRTDDLTERRILIAQGNILVDRLREIQADFDEHHKIDRWIALRHSRLGTKSHGRKFLAKAPLQTFENIARFVLIELDMAVTFCQRALSTNDPKTRSRNIENALKGYETALRHLSKHNPPIDDVAFQQKHHEVKSLLQQLGRQV